MPLHPCPSSLLNNNNFIPSTFLWNLVIITIWILDLWPKKCFVTFDLFKTKFHFLHPKVQVNICAKFGEIHFKSPKLLDPKVLIMQLEYLLHVIASEKKTPTSFKLQTFSFQCKFEISDFKLYFFASGSLFVCLFVCLVVKNNPQTKPDQYIIFKYANVDTIFRPQGYRRCVLVEKCFTINKSPEGTSEHYVHRFMLHEALQYNCRSNV